MCQVFSYSPGFLHHFVLTKLATSSIGRVNINKWLNYQAAEHNGRGLEKTDMFGQFLVALAEVDSVHEFLKILKEKEKPKLFL